MALAPLSKKELVGLVAERAELEERDVSEMLGALMDVVADEIAEGRYVTVPGIVRLRPSVVPARPRRFGMDHFKGEERWFDAKPAKTTLRATPARVIKDALPTARSAAGKVLAKEKAKKARARARNGR